MCLSENLKTLASWRGGVTQYVQTTPLVSISVYNTSYGVPMMF
jgi:hypothetical protein